MKKMKLAFTLAEVLITLGIIGVVAAVTLPSLNNNVSDKALSTQTMKAYNTLQNAINLYMSDQGADNTKYLIYNEKEFVKKFKVKVACNQSDGFANKGCFADKYYDQQKREIRLKDYVSTGEIYALDDGTVFSVDPNITLHGSWIIVDVNGSKKPNTMGLDTWTMRVQADGSLDGVEIEEGSKTNSSQTKSTLERAKNNCKNGDGAYGCFTLFLRNGFKFDY